MEFSWGQEFSLGSFFFTSTSFSPGFLQDTKGFLCKTRRRAFDLVLGALMLSKAAAAAPLLLAFLYHIYTALYPSVAGSWSRGKYISVHISYILFHCALQGAYGWSLD